MPFGDGTGPSGLGPRTGRSLGPCATPFARAGGLLFRRRWLIRGTGIRLGQGIWGSGRRALARLARARARWW